MSEEGKKKRQEALAMTLDITKFKNLCCRFSPDMPVMVRGKHGIGKSQVIYQVASRLRDDFYKSEENCAQMVEALKNEPSIAKLIAKTGGKWNYDMGVPVIERRLSQMTEGDIIGLPLMDGRGTEFKPVIWLLNSCAFPVVLFLDELNRAIKGVEQATFQLADSKAFYGNLLHSGTRIYIAVNIGASYSVEEFDPAAISRYAVIDLEPTIDEFCAFARENCNYLLSDFIATNHEALEGKRNEIQEPNKKGPDRRAWVRLDHELTQSGLYDTPDDVTFLHMCAAMVGFHFGNMYWNHVKNNQFNISGKEIAYNWTEVRKKLPNDPTVRQQKFVELANRVGDYLKDNQVDKDKVGKQLNEFLIDCPSECCIVVWNLLSKNKPNFYALHPFINQMVIKRITGAMASSQNNVVSSTPPNATTTNPIIPRQKK